MKSLSDILQEYFGLVGPAFQDCDPQRNEYGDWDQKTMLTDNGWKAYIKLTNLVEDLGNLGVMATTDAKEAIENLDKILTSKGTNMDGKLALTPQQQKLMDEWKELSHKMHEAGIMFVLDDEYANIYVLNGNNIEATANEWEGLSEEELEGFADFNDDNDAQFMDFPNLTVFNENANRLYIKYK